MGRECGGVGYGTRGSVRGVGRECERRSVGELEGE